MTTRSVITSAMGVAVVVAIGAAYFGDRHDPPMDTPGQYVPDSNVGTEAPPSRIDAPAPQFDRNDSVLRTPVRENRPATDRQAAGQETAVTAAPRLALVAAASQGEPPVTPPTTSSGANIATPPPEPPAGSTVAIEPPPPQAKPKPVEPVLTIQKDTVLGIRLDQMVTTQSARVDDKISARVIRDVTIDGRTVIRSGARVEGVIVFVERGLPPRERGKAPAERARLGIRFMAIVLAGDTRVPIQTDAIYRVAEAPGEPSSAASAGPGLGPILPYAGRPAAPPRASTGPLPVLNATLREAWIPAGAAFTVKLTAPASVPVRREESPDA